MTTGQYDITSIQRVLPHRYPMLLVDRITSLEPWCSIAAYKNVTINEPFFQGHFPGQPVMPGVLMIEAMGQAAALFVSLSYEVAPDKTPDGVELDDMAERKPFFAAFDKVKFRRQIIPGDRLDMEVKLLRLGSRIWKVATLGTVDGQRAVEAEMTAAIA